MTENAGPNLRPFLPQVPSNLAEAYLAVSGLDATIKMIQEQVAVTTRGLVIAGPIIEQHREWVKAMVGMVNAAHAQLDFPGLAAMVELARASVAEQVDLSGVGTLTATALPSLQEIVEEAREAQRALGGSELEADLVSLLSEDDRAGIDGQMALLDLSDPATKTVLSWYVGIVIGMLYLVLILDMNDAVERYNAILTAVGIPTTTVEVTKLTARGARKLLDSQFPTRDEEG